MESVLFCVYFVMIDQNVPALHNAHRRHLKRPKQLALHHPMDIAIADQLERPACRSQYQRRCTALAQHDSVADPCFGGQQSKVAIPRHPQTSPVCHGGELLLFGLADCVLKDLQEDGALEEPRMSCRVDAFGQTTCHRIVPPVLIASFHVVFPREACAEGAVEHVGHGLSCAVRRRVLAEGKGLPLHEHLLIVADIVQGA